MNGDNTELIVERRVAASPATVFSFFADRDQWLRWQGVEADIDPRPGGLFRMNVRGDGFASGRFVEIEPDRRIVFTWGWEMPGNPVPPGSSIVEIDLIPDGGDTIVRLIHRDLPDEAFELHREGWQHYIGRLASRAAGEDPGPGSSGADVIAKPPHGRDQPCPDTPSCWSAITADVSNPKR